MEIKPLTPDTYALWNEFCSGNPYAWFRHKTDFIDYIVNCRFDGKSKNLSFFVYQNNQLVALVPLVLQSIYETPGLLELAFTDTNTPFPCLDKNLSPDNKKQILNFIFEQVDLIAKANGAAYTRYFVDPLTENILSDREKINPIIYFDYNDTSITTNIMKLDQNEDELLRNIRKGHKADIKFAEKQGYTVSVFDKSNITPEAFAKYRDLHFAAAGRKTRKDESWDMMFKWITNGDAVLALTKLEASGPFIAGSLVITYDKKAYYGSAAMDPSIDRMRGLGHIIQWGTIKYLKQNGFTHYDLGTNAYIMLSQNIPGRKDLSISTFKSGFANAVHPFYRGEKFYSEEYFRKLKSSLIEEYCGVLFPKEAETNP